MLDFPAYFVMRLERRAPSRQNIASFYSNSLKANGSLTSVRTDSSSKWSHLMNRILSAALVSAILTGVGGRAFADEKAAKEIIDKAIKAAGGEDALSKAKAVSWKTKATITFNGADNQMKGRTVIQGLDHLRSEFEGDFNGNTVKGVTVLNGGKGWRQFGDNTMELDGEALDREKWNLYLQVTSTLLLPLKAKGVKLDSGADEKVGDKPASVVKVTTPEGKDLTIFFDKESSLPVKIVAKVFNFQGEEVVQESTYSDFKEMNGIKRATKSLIKRDGERFMESEVLEFKILDKVDAEEFSEPK